MLAPRHVTSITAWILVALVSVSVGGCKVKKAPKTGWAPPTNAGGTTTPTAEPRVAMDGAGGALLTFVSVGSATDLLARRYTPAGGWASPVGPLDAATTAVETPELAMDASGAALAIWSQENTTTGRNEILALRYEPSTGWGATPVKLDDGVSLGATRPYVAMDGTGSGIAVWLQEDFSNRSTLWANRYRTDIPGFEGSVPLDGGGEVTGAHAATSAGNHLVVVWTESDGTSASVYATRYDAADESWTSPEPLESEDTDAAHPRVAIDDEGNAVAVWLQANSGGSGARVWASRFDAASGTWTAGAPVDATDAVDAEAAAPQVAMDASGDAVAVWVRLEGSDYRVRSSRLSGGVWQAAQGLESDLAGTALEPRVAMDGAGNATVVWTQDVGRGVIWARRYATASGWASATKLQSSSTGDGSAPRVAMDGSATVTAWVETTSSGTQVWTSVFR